MNYRCIHGEGDMGTRQQFNTYDHGDDSSERSEDWAAPGELSVKYPQSTTSCCTYDNVIRLILSY